MSEDTKSLKEILVNATTESMNACAYWLEHNPNSEEVVIADKLGGYVSVIAHDRGTLVTSFNFSGSGMTATGFKRHIAENCIEKWKIDATIQNRREYLLGHMESLKEILEMLESR
jgi:hypothetical protein